MKKYIAIQIIFFFCAIGSATAQDKSEVGFNYWTPKGAVINKNHFNSLQTLEEKKTYLESLQIKEYDNHVYLTPEARVNSLGGYGGDLNLGFNRKHFAVVLSGGYGLESIADVQYYGATAKAIGYWNVNPERGEDRFRFRIGGGVAYTAFIKEIETNTHEGHMKSNILSGVAAAELGYRVSQYRYLTLGVKYHVGGEALILNETYSTNRLEVSIGFEFGLKKRHSSYKRSAR